MKYRLNYNWNGHEKGHVFVVKESDAIRDWKGYIVFDKEEIDLLVMSGALTPLTEEKVELPPLLEEKYEGSSTLTYLVRDHNQIIKHLKQRDEKDN